MADELRQELLSKARGIGAAPKKVLINEGIERWLPMVMGIAGPGGPKGPPFKVPPLPKGQDLWNQLVRQTRELNAPDPLLSESGKKYFARYNNAPTMGQLGSDNPNTANIKLKDYFDKYPGEPNFTEGLDWSVQNDELLHNILRFLAD